MRGDRAQRRRVAPQPLPGAVRSRARDADVRGRRARPRRGRRSGAARRRHRTAPAAARGHRGSREPRRVSRGGRLCGVAPSVRARVPAAPWRRSRRRSCWAAGAPRFPPARRWRPSRARPQLPHYLVCNADESEPGTFKDRVLMEGDPFAIVEAMTIAAYATGCERGFIYIRGEYPLAARRIENAIGAARAAGLLGDDVMGGGMRFDIEVRRGAGAYICGEETALFNSIEGKRGEPRSKPPFPARSRTLRQADAGEQRRDAREPAADSARRRRGVRARRHARVDGHAPVLPVGHRGAPRSLRSAVRHDARRVDRDGGRRARARHAARDPARRRRGHVRRARTRSICV